MTARAMLAGASAALSLASVGVGLSAWALPTQTVAGPAARVLDAYAPWLLGIGVFLAVLTLALGARRLGAVLILVTLGSAIAPVAAYRDVTRAAPASSPPDLTVLFFNVFAGNTTDGARIVDAAMATGADILVFAEAEALADHRERLEARYGYVSDCRGDTCELLIATNLPVIRSWQLQLNPAWAERYAVLEVEVPDHGPVFVAAAHLAKPWMSGIAEPELARLTAQMNWLTGPAIVLGDFNMPPWSQPMRSLLRDTGFRATRVGPATWPADAARALRLPIDHVLVRGDLTLGPVETFGQGLGSNHLGLLAGITPP